MDDQKIDLQLNLARRISPRNYLKLENCGNYFLETENFR